MIRLWLKLMLPLVGTMIAVWCMAFWIYTLNPDFDEEMVQPDVRSFRPHVLTLAGMSLPEVEARIPELQSAWDMNLTAGHAAPPPVTLGSRELGRLLSEGGVFAWRVTAVGRPDIVVAVEVVRHDPFSSLTNFYVPLATERAWARLEAVRPDERDRLQQLASNFTMKQDRIVIAILVVVALLIAVSFGWYVMLRLKGIRRVLHRIRDGDLTARVGVAGKDLIHQLGHDCDAMATQIQQLITQQDTMLRMLAHELRTPLARIDLGVHLAEREMGVHPRLSAVRHEVELLEKLLQELTRLIRVQHQVASEIAVSVDLQAVVAETVSGWAERHPDVSLSLEIAADAKVHGHAALLGVAVANLLNNAVRFARTRVLIGACRQDGHVRLWIDDDGHGVPEADRQRIFQPFVSLAGGAGAGHGLGLAIAHRILEASGGTVICTASPIGGARFLLSWPEHTDV